MAYGVWRMTYVDARFNSVRVIADPHQTSYAPKRAIVSEWGDTIHTNYNHQSRMSAYKATASQEKYYNADPFSTHSSYKSGVESVSASRLKDMVPASDVDARESLYTDLRNAGSEIKMTTDHATIGMNTGRAVGHGIAFLLAIPTGGASFLGSATYEATARSAVAAQIDAKVVKASRLTGKLNSQVSRNGFSARAEDIQQELGVERGNDLIAAIAESDRRAQTYQRALTSVSLGANSLKKSFQNAGITRTSAALELSRIGEHFLTSDRAATGWLA